MPLICLYITLFVNFSHFHLLKNNWEISTEPGTTHPLVNRIQDCSNYIDTKIVFFRIKGQLKKKEFGAKHPFVNFVQMKWHTIFQREIIFLQIANYNCQNYNFFSPEPPGQFKQICSQSIHM